MVDDLRFVSRLIHDRRFSEGYVRLIGLGWSPSEAASAPSLAASPGASAPRRVGISSGAFRRSFFISRCGSVRRPVLEVPISRPFLDDS